MAATLTAGFVEINDTHSEIALERLTANMDLLADWLSGHCNDQKDVRGERALRVAGRLEQASGAELVQIAIFGVASASDAERLQALKLLLARYMADKAEYLRTLEDEAAVEWA